jgi:hypothetical protein
MLSVRVDDIFDANVMVCRIGSVIGGAGVVYE